MPRLSDNFQQRAVASLGCEAAQDLLMALDANSPESPTFSGVITLSDGCDIVFGRAIGTVVGTDPTQKIGVWGTYPVVQPSSPDQEEVGEFATQTLSGLVGVPATVIPDVGAVYDQFLLNNIHASLATEINHIFADLVALRTLLNQIRADLVSIGIIKGS